MGIRKELLYLCSYQPGHNGPGRPVSSDGLKTGRYDISLLLMRFILGNNNGIASRS